ncbi:Transcription antitermination protein, NusG [Vreelandella titanicae BH1]|uniref:Transcription termination/antitermination protein NusG n=8 Tax=Halomonadaceae TaxID=28256 RepID=L9U7R6_9GAMM|nr:Transcription antitermination protein, NusG [Halomonas titanicae BH1]
MADPSRNHSNHGHCASGRFGGGANAVVDRHSSWLGDVRRHWLGVFMSKRWYVVHAYSGFEKHVMRSLIERVKMYGMEDRFGEILVPTEEVVEMRDGKRRKSERKFYPGYVLVEMEMADETWHLVNETPRVMGFIGGTKEKPAPITSREADAILLRVKDGTDKPRPKTMFEPGQSVRVVDGPFADFNGVVEEVNYEKSRLHVSVLIFGRSTPVELEFSQVEKE